VLALVAGSGVAVGVLYPVALPLARALGGRPALESWLNLAGALLAHVLVLRVVERRPLADVGLGAAAARPARLLAGFGLGALAIAVPVALLLAAGLFRLVPSTPGDSVAAAAALVGWTLVPAALFEELLVRGYPFLVLRESLGALPALLVTSVAFGVLHAQNPGATVASVAAVTLAGVFLGGVLLATGSLWAAWMAHLAWNATLAVGYHAVVSGLAFAAPDYRLVDAGPDWLTGGPWGPEGGVAAAGGMLAALAFLHLRASRARRASHAAATAEHALVAAADRAA
jgi:membrane protease YdiL (CAAX protease family)